MERAQLLCDKDGGKRRSWMVLSLLVGVVAPMAVVVPFLFALEKNGENDPSRKGLMVSSVWLGSLVGYVEKILFIHVMFLHSSYVSNKIIKVICFISLITSRRKLKNKEENERL